MLRGATDADSTAIAHLWQSAWASANPCITRLEPLEHWLARVHAEFNTPNNTLVYQADNGEIVAFMVVNTIDDYLHQLFVHPHAQRMGLGSKLIVHICALCPSGWSLHVATSNDGARRFYARHGLAEGTVSRNPVTGRERVRYAWIPPTQSQ